jgi:hypothetical protein
MIEVKIKVAFLRDVLNMLLVKTFIDGLEEGCCLCNKKVEKVCNLLFLPVVSILN